MNIELTSKPNSQTDIGSIKVTYDGAGNLREIRSSVDPEKPLLAVTDFAHGLSDFKHPDASSGYYSLQSTEEGMVEICHSTVWEDTQASIKKVRFADWVDECAGIISGEIESVARAI